MANTLSVMTNVLRNVVSKQRIRYKEKGFNLDLAYVCDNIIAMGYPAEKYESMYRNRLEDVYKFLEENHQDHYKIYNLCLERSYDIKKFHGRVAIYPFEDHNPPTIELIQNFCRDVDKWLKADRLNVAAVHCKAGKGRTGTMICCYLLYSGQQRTAEDALACYDEKRTKDRKGVTIPSQRRYVQYFSKLIRLGLPYVRRTLQFCEIRFSEANLLHNQGTVYCSISVLQDATNTIKVQQLENLQIDFRKTLTLEMRNSMLPITGDIKIELTKNNKKIFHFWFNTFFVADFAILEGEGNEAKFVYTLHKWEIDDAHKDKENKCFAEDFKVELVFYVNDTNISENQMKKNQSSTLAILTPIHSSSSEPNHVCDQKSSSRNSNNTNLRRNGNRTTSNSNGYDINYFHKNGNKKMEEQQLKQQYLYALQPNCNTATKLSPSLPTLASVLGTDFISEQQQQQQHQQQQQQQQQQHLIKRNTTALAVVNSHQRHSGTSAVKLSSSSSVMDDYQQQPSASCGSILLSNNNDFNSSHSYVNSNSSKCSSVSSQSSSSLNGDNEEDWESARLTPASSLLSTATTATVAAVQQPKSLIEQQSIACLTSNNQLTELEQYSNSNSNNINTKQQQQLESTSVRRNKQQQQLNNSSIRRRQQQQQQNGCDDIGSDTMAVQSPIAIGITLQNTRLCHCCRQTDDRCSELKCC